MDKLIEIRVAKAEDARYLSSLSSQLGYPSDTNSISRRLRLISRDPDHCVFVAVENETVVGWIHAFEAHRIESDPFAEIAGLVVSKSHRRKGVGRRLLQLVKGWALQKGVSVVRVRCQVKRTGAHQFYRVFGFSLSKVQNVFTLSLKPGADTPSSLSSKASSDD